jgi:hypothetical protein
VHAARLGAYRERHLDDVNLDNRQIPQRVAARKLVIFKARIDA